ncbi:alpha/beta hydrolase fold domain-containing protein [Nocardia rhamnosiphila]|uniref:alpha/beta hydrolase fold domain-containing protein n=1 Tax=Nocardia rhamnosiphila TaxID=426716 RepID=UPI00379D00BA
MKNTTGIDRLPRGVRLLHALQKEPDWPAMTATELASYREKANRLASSRLARVITGRPDRGAEIGWEKVSVADRVVPVRVYRPSPTGAAEAALPLVLQVHGGGFAGTAAQCDWMNSHLAVRLPAVVVSVEHRLLAWGSPMLAAVDDGWDVLCHVIEYADRWGIDPARVAVAGESGGALIAALAAIRAGSCGLPLRAQVLTNPVCDLTGTMLDYASISRHADGPGPSEAKLRLVRELAVPPGTDPAAVSPIYAADLGGLAPALVIVPTLDSLADHGRRYAQRLRESGTSADVAEHPGAPHAFVTLPGVAPQAAAARRQITEFLRARLAAASPAGPAPARAR